TEKEALANQIAESTASLAQAEEKLTLLKKDEQAQENKLSRLTSRCRESQQKIAGLNRLIDQTRVQEKQLIRPEKAFKVKLDDLRKDEQVIQTEAEAVASRLVNFTRRLEELTIQKRDFEDKVNQLVREKEIIKGNIDEFNKLIQGQKMKAVGLGKKREQFEFEISEKEVKIGESQKNIITLSKSLEERETVLEKLKEKEKLVQAKLLKIRENLKEIEKEISLIQNVLEAAKGNHKNIKEQEVSINTELGNLETSLVIVRKRLIDCGEEKWEFEMRILEDKRKKEFAKIEKAEREVARANQEMKEILSEKRKKVKQWKNLPQARTIKEKVSKEEKKLDEERLIYHYSRAFKLDCNERYDEAAVEYAEVLKINPNDADAHYNLALIYDDHLNEKRKAIQHYREYLELKPAAEDASQVASWIIKAHKDLEWDSWK
ncbi:MAG: tetratricopeptide repeat protein, partial [Candidatus Omnitrophica bacterium]|nr:tetratricopeptide repeat protein [Candidatus Omnitrophota bacterium]